MASDEPTRLQPPLPLGEVNESVMYTAFKPTYILQHPKMDWKCELHPGTHWHCEEGKQPNAFHRFMQRLCFGVKWSRIVD